MFSRKTLLSCVLAGVFACMAANASAQATVTNQPVFFTFDKEFTVPGMTLPAGQYEFRLATTRGGDREVIEIYNRDTGKHVTTAMAIGTTMSDLQGVPEKPAVRFYEAAANSPAAVRNWWYPGIHGGHEFIYPREQAQGFARFNSEGVLTTEGSLESGSVTRMTESAEAAPAAQSAAAAPAPEPTPAPAVAERQTQAQQMPEQRTTVSDSSRDVRQPEPASPAPADTMAQAQPAPAAEAEAMEPARETLPRTASARPVLLAIGFASLIAGLGLARRRRVA